jgi:hypothetical protein
MGLCRRQHSLLLATTLRWQQTRVGLKSRLLSKTRPAAYRLRFGPLSDIPSSGIFRVAGSYRWPTLIRPAARSCLSRNIPASHLGLSCRRGIALPPIGERREDVRLAHDRSCNQQKVARGDSGSISECALSKVADAQRAFPLLALLFRVLVPKALRKLGVTGRSKAAVPAQSSQCSVEAVVARPHGTSSLPTPPPTSFSQPPV